MAFPPMLAVTLSQSQKVDGGKAFPVELTWLTEEGRIQSAIVAPKPDWLALQLAVEEHGLTWDVLADTGRDLKEILVDVDSELAGQKVYSYRRDFLMMQNRKGSFEHRWFETPEGDNAPFRLPWAPAVSCIGACKLAHKTTKGLPPWHGRTRIIYALSYYSMLVQQDKLSAFLDLWMQET